MERLDKNLLYRLRFVFSGTDSFVYVANSPLGFVVWDRYVFCEARL